MTTTLAIDTFLPYMRDVIRCEQSLHELNLMWRMIESSAKMNCPVEARTILPTMASTRAGFNQLEQELVQSLVREKVANVLAEIGTKAHYVIDIVVRNLYERTADVGFLATDHELCAFVAGRHGDRHSIAERLRAYRSKYTVYDEILLLDPHGNVLVQIDPQSPLTQCRDTLIARTLASDGWVETFGWSDLRPHKRKALIYSRRMLDPDTGAVIGLLCLCFHFEQEMAGIFHSHRDPAGRAILLLLDGENRVIESGDPLWIPLGAIVPVNRDGDTTLRLFGGREYLVRTLVTDGYQGYPGPVGWQGQVMMPVDVAFTGNDHATRAALDPALADGLLSQAHTFCPPLFQIISAASTIRRVVWNGQVMTAGENDEARKLKSVLEQISETGARSDALFANSIGELYDTVLASKLRHAEFTSHLLVDLLDRNLYERSDDCRWWALTPELRSALAGGNADTAAINTLLDYINTLYTVYTRLVVYDADGVIVAASNEDLGAPSVCGDRIDAATLAAVRALRSEQAFHVTPFDPAPLYGDVPTYVYHAAIRDPHNAAVIVGGIGIVFDAGPEFAAMLRGALDSDTSMSALFTDRQGRIIASTDATRPVGSLLELDPALRQLPNGGSSSRIVIHDGHYAVLGVTVSHGYREFKVSDGYCEDVLAIVYVQLGAVSARNHAGHSAALRIDSDPTRTGGQEFATFFVDDALLALAAGNVLEALPASALKPLSLGGRTDRVGVVVLQRDGETERYVWVFDLGYLFNGVPSTQGSGNQVVIVELGGQVIGLLVGELHAVAQFDIVQITTAPFVTQHSGRLVCKLIKANEGRLLIQVLDIDFLFGLLLPAQPTVAALAA
ncbi:hypothetical protein IMCC9480_104 [Oxalobacteraceae bacterium IMCC9480]|nr:hypothetical protein IMCC9480_104 [Oxalobacteraceae bacterium IMCC9480]NDP60006.1 chemotaxis protein CheW [Oxalobacteraceae bacterium]